LSNTHNPANLKHATNLISRHKRTGNVFINTAGDAGLSLYAAIPKSFKHHFIDAFKRNPKTIIGLSRSHLIVHSIKALNKYGLVSLILPFTTLAIAMSALSQSIVWIIFIISSVALFMTITRKSNKQRKEKEHA